MNNIKTSVVAKDLLVILKQSRTATELTDTSLYEFVLDKHFTLHITNEGEVDPEVVTEEDKDED